MHITVEAVRGDIVSFTCAAGAASGIWRDNVRHPPVPGASYLIELTLSGATMDLTKERVPAVRCHGRRVTLVGQLEAVDPDGVGYFRLEGLTLLETTFPAGAWIEIDVAERGLQIFPHDRL
jgi:hypothetical protein